MEFNLSEEERAFRDRVVRRFVDNEVRPGVVERDREGIFPYALYRRLSEVGLTGVSLSEEWGGTGGGTMPLVLAVEEISRVDQSLAVSYFVSHSVANIVRYAGNEEQKRRFLVPLVRGTHVGAFGLTEPDAGSDNQGMKTIARLDGDEWVINGSKAFITNAGTDITLFIIIFCITGERSNGKKEFSAIIVPSGTPGLLMGPPEKKLGWRSSDTRAFSLDNCRVPYENLIGQRGDGLHCALDLLHYGRVIIAASAVGLAQGCLDECLAYSQSRLAFGRSLGQFQGYQFQIADMATEIEAARLMVYQATRNHEAGTLTHKDSSMTKLFVTEMAQRAATHAVDLFGGIGFMEDSHVARFYRDVKVNTIGDGTANIHRTIIARSLGLPRLF